MSNQLNHEDRGYEKLVLAKAARSIFDKEKIREAILDKSRDPEDGLTSKVPLDVVSEFESDKRIRGLCAIREKEEGLPRFVCDGMNMSGLEGMKKRGDAYFPEPHNDMCVDLVLPLLTIKGDITIKQGCVPSDDEKYTNEVEGAFTMRIENVLSTLRFRFDSEIEFVEKASIEIDEDDHNWKEQIKMNPKTDVEFKNATRGQKAKLQAAMRVAMKEVEWEQKVANQLTNYLQSDDLSELLKRHINEKLA